MTEAEMEELRFLLILSKMKENAEKLAKWYITFLRLIICVELNY